MLCLVQGFTNKGSENKKKSSLRRDIKKNKEINSSLENSQNQIILINSSTLISCTTSTSENQTNDSCGVGSGVMVAGNGVVMSPNSNSSNVGIQSDGNSILETSAISDSTVSTTATTPTTITVVSGATTPTERQSLKHLSASAPTIRTAVMRNGSGSEQSTDFVLAPSSSKSRQKKFHRHFTSVPLEETVLDYYSCALVADILLQGYLYITENHFAFYSNVFGYVTKLLIPVVDVVRITKERTAKIIPNAVGICTRSEKHVFASLLSRDTTHKLMCNVWQYSIQLEADEVNRVNKELKREEQRITDAACVPDESSGESGSGNDSAIEPQFYGPSPLNSPAVEKVILVAKNSGSALSASTSSNDENGSQTSVPVFATSTILPTVQLSQAPGPYLRPGHRSSIVQGPVSNLTTFATDNRKRTLRTIGQAPSLLVLATAILVILFISAAVLLSRISTLHQKVNDRPIIHDSEQFYQELLAWQNKLHTSSADEIHQYINMNLQQIIRVRQSLEALSLLFTSNHPESSAAYVLKDSSSRPLPQPT